MKIIVAKTAGFCMGVKRAVDLALEHSGKESHGIQTLGPLIHNKQTLEVLKQRGVTTLDENKPTTGKATLLVRAHGIPPEMQKKYSTQGHRIIDGTCPKVKTVHKVIERFREQGFSIVITGDEGHAEVIGLMGYAGKSGYLVQTVDDIAKLPDLDKVCLVSQTTFDRILFDTIADAVRKRFTSSEVVIKKTICAATDQRQAETEELAKQVDALIVVGGKNSANTQRLAKIGTDCGKITQHVETENEINWDSISQCKTIGITAGASTPTWMIKRVHDYIQFMSQTRRRSIKNILLYMLDIFANMNIFVSLGAVAVYYASCYLQGFDFNLTGGLIAFTYFLTMYLWNSLASIEKTQHHGISRYHFYHAHKRIFYIIVTFVILLTLGFCAFYSLNLFYLMLFATLAGLAYHMSILPSFLQHILPYKTLKDIPTSRELFIALAWCTVLTFMPRVLANTFTIDILSIALFAWIFIIAYLRSLIFDLRDIEGDRIMGRETLITIIGEKRARKVMLLMIWICLAALLIVPSVLGLSVYKSTKAIQFFFQIPVLFYTFVFIRWNSNIHQKRNTLFIMLTDGMFYLMALGAVMADFFLR
ncbi:MAG: 4-hydroxy-3-methylbut-2-enyl diphosphate reductase [Fibrobacter sp.]|nr:4-hydroxy-3-methylbut-2-enyl diphosphate reductase [Fibrobacter sp.]